jgi:hypothetical protein
MELSTVVNSQIKFCFFRNGLEYFIEAKAIFTKKPFEAYVDMRTDYKLTEIKVNNFLMENIEQVSEFARADTFELERQIRSKLVDYADELPF